MIANIALLIMCGVCVVSTIFSIISSDIWSAVLFLGFTLLIAWMFINKSE